MGGGFLSCFKPMASYKHSYGYMMLYFPFFKTINVRFVIPLFFLWLFGHPFPLPQKGQGHIYIFLCMYVFSLSVSVVGLDGMGWGDEDFPPSSCFFLKRLFFLYTILFHTFSFHSSSLLHNVLPPNVLLPLYTTAAASKIRFFFIVHIIITLST